MHYGTTGPFAVPTGPPHFWVVPSLPDKLPSEPQAKHNTARALGRPLHFWVVSGLPDKLPSEPQAKHSTARALGRLGHDCYRAGSCLCRAKSCGSRAGH
jgi:hypothetical protein